MAPNTIQLFFLQEEQIRMWIHIKERIFKDKEKNLQLESWVWWCTHVILAFLEAKARIL